MGFLGNILGGIGNSLFGNSASPDQLKANAGAQDLATSMSNAFNTRFQGQNQTLGQLGSEIGNIQSGNTGFGFGEAEQADLTSTIMNSYAQQGQNELQATVDKSAGQTFGNTGNGVTSGVTKQLEQEAGSDAAKNQANALLSEKAAGWAQGRTNATQTAQLLGTEAQLQNPEGFATSAIDANKNEMSDATSLYQQQQQQDQAVMGLVEGAATTALTGGIGGIAGVASSAAGASQPLAFFQGAANALKG